MLDDKAVERIADLGRKAAAVEVHDLADCGCPELFIVRQGDSVETRTKPPGYKRDTVESLDGLIAAAGRWEATTVWHKGSKVIALHDDARRKNSTAFAMQQTKIYQTILALDGDAPVFVPQKQLVRTLSHDLADALEPTSGLLNAIRQLSFSRKSDGASTVEHGKESLGRQVEDEVQGRTDIPERFTLLTQVFVLPGSPMLPIRMSLEIDVETSRLAVRPLPDELVKAVRETHDWIHAELVASVGDATDVFYGSPGA